MQAASLRVTPTFSGQSKSLFRTGFSAVDTVAQAKCGVFVGSIRKKKRAQHHPWMSRGVFFGQELLVLADYILCFGLPALIDFFLDLEAYRVWIRVANALLNDDPEAIAARGEN